MQKALKDTYKFTKNRSLTSSETESINNKIQNQKSPAGFTIFQTPKISYKNSIQENLP